MQEKKTVTSLLGEMKSDISSYVVNTLEIGKLEGYEKISKGSASVSFILLIFFLGFLFLGFFLFTLGFYLSESIFNCYWKGFGVVAGVLLLILFVLFFCKKVIKRNITNSVVSFLMKKEENEVDFSKIKQ